MAYLADIGAWNVGAFGVLLFLVLVAAREIGLAVGRRFSAGNPGTESVGPVVSALLALLAFVLALTLTFANARFTERREGTLREANAIGTAWLRAEALGQPAASDIASLLQDYTRLRRDNVRAGRDLQVLQELEAQVNALQTRIWADVAILVQAQPNPTVTALQAAVNDVFDATTDERFAFSFRFPAQVLWLLLGLSCLGMGMLGYQAGLRRHGHRAVAAIFAFALTVVIVNILDLGAPRLGRFRTTTQAYDWDLASMNAPVSAAGSPTQKPAP